MNLKTSNSEIRLARRPGKEISADDFIQVDTAVVPPQADQVVVQVQWLSMDTYLYERTVNNDIGPMLPLGARMVGRGLGTVVAGSLPAGTLVSGELGWQEYATVAASGVTPLERDGTPETWHLSVLGAPGLTAWIALHKVLNLTPGKTLLVSGAAGTVGSLVGQLALEMGLEVIGIAGGPEKCDRLLQNGFRAAIDRKATADESWPQAIQSAAPQGVDFYFDNAGGKIFEAAVQTINPRGHIILCGHSGEYTGHAARITATDLLYKGLTMHGFRVWDHSIWFTEARAALRQLLKQEKLHIKENIHAGLASAPAALGAMMAGKGLGKHVVKVG